MGKGKEEIPRIESFIQSKEKKLKQLQERILKKCRLRRDSNPSLPDTRWVLLSTEKQPNVGSKANVSRFFSTVMEFTMKLVPERLLF